MNKKESPLTVSPAFDEFFARRLSQIEDQAKKDAEQIEKRRMEIVEVNKKIKKKSEILERQKGELLELVKERERAVETALKQNLKVQQKLEAGKISMQEHAKFFRTEDEIREFEREAFAREMRQTLAVLRSIDAEIKALVRTAWEKKRDVEFLRQRHFENKFQLVKSAANQLDQLRRSNLEAEAVLQKLKTLDPDFPSGQIFVCESIEQLELLAINSIVLEDHLPELGRYIDKLRASGFDFSKQKIQATYLRAPTGPDTMTSGFSFLAIRKDDKRQIVTTGEL